MAQKTPIPPPAAALASWIIPGAGYVIAGERARGFTAGVTVILLFIMGLWIGGIRVVEAPKDLTKPLEAVMDKPWFIGQVLAGPMALFTARAGAGEPMSHARMNEIGTLYTAVAGMLNLLVVIDSAHRAGRAGVATK